MAIRVSTTAHTAAVAAAAAAANGAKNAAFRNSLQTSLGANPVVKLARSGVTVASKALVGSLPLDGNAFKISAASWANTTTSADADIDSGTWVIRVEKAADAAVYLEGDLGKTGSGRPYLLSGDIVDALGVSQQDIYFQCPTFDTTSVVTTVQTIIDDMGLTNEATAAGVNNPGWNTLTSTGSVVMGTIPSGNRLPSWALADINSVYTTNEYWTAYLMWWVLFEEAGNTATNTRVEFRYHRTYFKYRNSPVWVAIQVDGFLENERYTKNFSDQLAGTLESVQNSSGNVEVYFPPNSNFIIHGWGQLTTINPVNLECVYSTIQARRVVRNAALPDDRASGKYLVQMGGDFYPTVGTSIRDVGAYNPGGGLARMKRVTNNWQSFNFTTLTNANQNYNAAGIAEDGRTGIAAMSTAALALNPPPLI